ncbi:hypothetical protein CWB99_07725 [Pseudoalteromonas rubra]|uniref:Carrier domain-containing protein n=1 Tax=Pseudoalteromonas rubra TaxID=43658 RepID=A0A5S3WQE5_9GAMM|nr:condensation domain-containing protein [Pseudoalteromonas rubra]TMP29969.1 hypothetical protein CWB99_07725 [Pseudoalteromonas rubra]TMP32197.1 hypothetical protein CWC00_13450 [Pseudoalteromonas rubra]
MSIKELVKQLESHGIQLSVFNGQLKYSAPKGALTPDLLARMKQHKEALLVYYKQKAHLAQIPKSTLPVPCSSPQRRILASHWLTQGEPVYNEQLVLMLTGEVDHDALEHAFKALLARHELLCLVPDQRGLLQENPDVSFSLITVQVDDTSADALQEKVRDHQHIPFEIESDLLLRACLFQCTDDKSYLSIVTHHFIGDAWSEQLMLNELKNSYEQYIQGRQTNLESLAVTYQDFCQWQADGIALGCYDEAIEKACHRLREAPQVHSLPLDKARGAMQTFRGASINTSADSAFRRAVQAFCARHKLTEFVFLSACYSLLLSKYSDDPHLCIGVPVAGRAKPELENLIGMFSNNVVLNYDFTQDDVFTDYLSRYNAMVLAVLEDQFAPFELLVEAMPGERSLSFSPIFQLMFAFRDYEFGGAHWDALAVQKVPGEHHIAKYDLFLAVDVEDNHYNFQWQYNTDLFDAKTISRWSNELLELIGLILECDNTVLSQYQLKSTAQSVMLADATNSHRDATLEQLILHSTSNDKATALISNGESVTYQALADLIDTISTNLSELGIKQGDKVAVALPRSYYQVPLILALFRLGTVYIPLDTGLPTKRINYILSDSDSTAIISHGLELADSTAQAIDLNWLLQDRQSSVRVAAQTETHLPAYIMYTSGTTGKPKGVQLSQRALVNQLLGCCERLELDKATRLFATTSFSFDMSLIELFAPLLAGGTSIVANDDEARYPDDTLRALMRYNANVYQSTPSRVQLLLEAGWQPTDNLTLICGGEPLLPKFSASLLNQVGRLFNGYGPTEICVYAMLKELHRDSAESALALLHAPLPNYGMCILKNQQVVPHGVVGELAIFGPGLADKYLNRAALTDDKFQYVSIAGKTHRVYMTGDLVRQVDCGELQFLGRADNQVKLLGYRIELDEITNATVPIDGVQAAHACLISNQQSAELVLFVQQPASGSLCPENISQGLSDLLPSYMVPSHIHLVSHVPTNANGKADWAGLVAEFKQPTTELSSDLPVTDDASQIMTIWTTGLGMRAIDPDVSFFKSGGDSLVLMRLLREVNQYFELELSVKDIYGAPTVNKLSVLIRDEQNRKKIIKNVVLEDEPEEVEGLWI